MARGLRFRHRIGLLVVLAAIAMVAVTIVTLVLGHRSQTELAGIETRYVPLIELDRDLKALFERVSHALEDAAGAADEGRLAEADRLDAELTKRLTLGHATIVDNGRDADAVEREYRAYFTAARGVSAALVGGTPAAQLATQIAEMQAAREKFIANLEVATTPDRQRIAAAFATANDSQVEAANIEIVVALAAIVLLALLSWQLTRNTVRALAEVSDGVQQLADSDEPREIPITSGDEIGDLAREANRTATRLRDYRERTEWLLAETQRQADELARARLAQQERADAAESATRELETFSYSVAHDLRSPLRGINGFTAALREDLGDTIPDDAKRYLDRITASTMRMSELIDALLGLARLTRTELTPQAVDLSKVAAEVAAQLQAPSTVEWVIAEGLTAHGDPRLVRAIVENLFGNAVKFTAKRDRARIEFGRNDDAFFVRDNGAGFDMAYADKLFSPFQRLHTSAEYAGSGIGLATVHRIVRRHGGKIWAEGAVNGGATFHFTLPPARG